MKKEVRASLTVEASLIITMTIGVIGILLSLWIYKFQECWYTQAISECLLWGSNKAILNDEDYINEVNLKWENVIEENYLRPQNMISQIDGNKNEITIKLNGETPIMGLPSLKITLEKEIDVIKPVTYIRKMTAIQEAIKNESRVSKRYTK